VSGPLFDQYKATLRRGHVAVLAGSFEEALAAYQEASRLVPERVLPMASQGTVLHRLDRWPEAAELFEQALRLAPDDEATLRARGTAREERGLRSGAAADFERLAFVLDVSGRSADAADAAAHAASLEPTPARRTLAERLAASASRLGRAPAVGEVEPEPRIVAPTAAESARDANVADPAQTWPPLDMPTPAPAPVEGPQPDPEELLADAAAAMAAGDGQRAHDLMLEAVLVHRAAGRLDAALDICLQLLGTAPGDPKVHLALANLQLDHGWTDLATEKIQLLERLTELTGDTQAAADVHGLAAERLRDEPAPMGASR
jgi:tetratricopeptide (TPR) repeat protein